MPKKKSFRQLADALCNMQVKLPNGVVTASGEACDTISERKNPDLNSWQIVKNKSTRPPVQNPEPAVTIKSNQSQVQNTYQKQIELRTFLTYSTTKCLEKTMLIGLSCTSLDKCPCCCNQIKQEQLKKRPIFNVVVNYDILRNFVECSSERTFDWRKNKVVVASFKKMSSIEGHEKLSVVLTNCNLKQQRILAWKDVRDSVTATENRDTSTAKNTSHETIKKSKHVFLANSRMRYLTPSPKEGASIALGGRTLLSGSSWGMNKESPRNEVVANDETTEVKAKDNPGKKSVSWADISASDTEDSDVEEINSKNNGDNHDTSTSSTDISPIVESTIEKKKDEFLVTEKKRTMVKSQSRNVTSKNGNNEYIDKFIDAKKKVVHSKDEKVEKGIYDIYPHLKERLRSLRTKQKDIDEVAGICFKKLMDEPVSTKSKKHDETNPIREKSSRTALTNTPQTDETLSNLTSSSQSHSCSTEPREKTAQELVTVDNNSFAESSTITPTIERSYASYHDKKIINIHTTDMPSGAVINIY